MYPSLPDSLLLPPSPKVTVIDLQALNGNVAFQPQVPLRDLMPAGVGEEIVWWGLFQLLRRNVRDNALGCFGTHLDSEGREGQDPREEEKRGVSPVVVLSE